MAFCARPRLVVDRALIARHVATVRDAIARVRSVLPAAAGALASDRTAREIVILNLFVAIQSTLDLAAHWLADAGWDVPSTYGGIFSALVEHGVLPSGLGDRLTSASGFRNLVAHQYGALDVARVHAIASSDLGDLEAFCALIARQSEG